MTPSGFNRAKGWASLIFALMSPTLASGAKQLVQYETMARKRALERSVLAKVVHDRSLSAEHKDIVAILLTTPEKAGLNVDALYQSVAIDGESRLPSEIVKQFEQHGLSSFKWWTEYQNAAAERHRYKASLSAEKTLQKNKYPQSPIVREALVRRAMKTGNPEVKGPLDSEAHDIAIGKRGILTSDSANALPLENPWSLTSFENAIFFLERFGRRFPDLEKSWTIADLLTQYSEQGGSAYTRDLRARYTVIYGQGSIEERSPGQFQYSSFGKRLKQGFSQRGLAQALFSAQCEDCYGIRRVLLALEDESMPTGRIPIKESVNRLSQRGKGLDSRKILSVLKDGMDRGWIKRTGMGPPKYYLSATGKEVQRELQEMLAIFSTKK